ncbi:unnamed protein product [Anisakis simplex]|uniref:Uncharacterized protein n=1 Tax=Anisakis simplex TaxID=6269 RepID=A0A0M3JTR3_ANISI|nr:unnamed protein product [Anisakis simplex]
MLSALSLSRHRNSLLLSGLATSMESASFSKHVRFAEMERSNNSNNTSLNNSKISQLSRHNSKAPKRPPRPKRMEYLYHFDGPHNDVDSAVSNKHPHETQSSSPLRKSFSSQPSSLPYSKNPNQQQYEVENDENSADTVLLKAPRQTEFAGDTNEDDENDANEDEQAS